jgi:hypothetical protein
MQTSLGPVMRRSILARLLQHHPLALPHPPSSCEFTGTEMRGDGPGGSRSDSRVHFARPWMSEKLVGSETIS